MIIVGVDPSLSYFGAAAIIDGELRYCNCIETHAPDSKRARFEWLAHRLAEYVSDVTLHSDNVSGRRTAVDVFAYEQFTGAQSSAAATSLAGSLGAAVTIGAVCARKLAAFSPRTVKHSIAHADADKTEICEAILELYPNAPLEKKRTRFTKQSEAIADAIAVAHCALIGAKQVD